MLNVSWNTVGDDGAAALAAAIEDGMNLLTLKLDHASVGRRGVIVLAESLWHNKSLTHLSLNGTSSLGEDGLKAVMQAVCMSRPANGLRVSLVGADTTVWRAAGWCQVFCSTSCGGACSDTAHRQRLRPCSPRWDVLLCA